MSGPGGPPPSGKLAAPPAAAPPRQRWRLYLRVPAAGGSGQSAAGPGAWLALFERSGLPLAGAGGARGRVVPAAQLPAGVAGEREVVDIVLGRRLPVAIVRDAVQAALPSSVTLVDLHDLWVGAPAAPATVVAADYRLEIAGGDLAWLAAATTALTTAGTLLRSRRREKKSAEYDLRPLIVSLAAAPPTPGSAGRCECVLRARLRHAADATGRPDEVLAALQEPPAPPPRAALDALSIVRERLVMEDDRGSAVGLD